jgi:hypothetical protein
MHVHTHTHTYPYVHVHTHIETYHIQEAGVGASSYGNSLWTWSMSALPESQEDYYALSLHICENIWQGYQCQTRLQSRSLCVDVTRSTKYYVKTARPHFPTSKNIPQQAKGSTENGTHFSFNKEMELFIHKTLGHTLPAKTIRPLLTLGREVSNRRTKQWLWKHIMTLLIGQQRGHNWRGNRDRDLPLW